VAKLTNSKHETLRDKAEEKHKISGGILHHIGRSEVFSDHKAAASC
jgi:hypothetical protein